MREDISIGNRIHKIGLFDLNTKGNASIICIANFLQETGMYHGFKIMEEGGINAEPDLAFVLTRLQIRMNRYPQWNEKINIITWLSPVADNYIIRNFELVDENKKLIGAAINSAVAFNLRERKLTSLPGDGSDLIVSYKEPPLPHTFEKLKIPEKIHFSRGIDVSYFDCDLYHHVNNTNYIKWALEVLPEEILTESFLREVNINFRSEADFNHRIITKAGNGEGENRNEYRHQLSREDTGKDLIIMKSTWEPK